MVFTLHRYILRELLKVFTLAAVALTVILSLGSILQPVQEYGVGPRQVLHLIVYFLPITLTFVLPMAALFACSLVYGRFASDNELDACKASGISLVTTLYPGLVLALMVAIANLLLSFYVMPYFVHLAEKSLKADAKQILFRNIQRRGYYTLPDDRHIIYADYTDLQNDTLMGLIVANVKGNMIRKIIAAESAKVSFEQRGNLNEVHVTTYNTYQIGLQDQAGFSLEWGAFSAEFGSLLGDDVKFKKIDEMKKIRQDPMRFYPIERLARDVHAQLTVELLAQDIQELFHSKAGQLYRLLGEPNSVRFSADTCTVLDEEQLELTGNLRVIEYETDTGQPVRQFEGGRAYLRIEGDKLAPTLTLDLYNARRQDTQELTMRHIVRGLLVPDAVEATLQQFRTESSLKPYQLAGPVKALRTGPSRALRRLQEQLGHKLTKTQVQIKAEVHSRLVFGIGCIPMILIGIGLGIFKRDAHLLTAFGASCVPGAMLIVCIMSGKNITENLGTQSSAGLILMWAGLTALIVLVLAIYRVLLRH